MDITIRSRNLKVTDSLRDAVEHKVARLSRLLDGFDRAEVAFTEERNPRIADKEVCEVSVHGHGHCVRAKAAAGDTLTAVDRVVDKLEHQMEKLKGKLVGRSHPRRVHSAANGAAIATDVDELPVATRIVRVEQPDIKPMTPEEAALQMDMLGHVFLMFTNAETDRAAVVYQRHDGLIGLIEGT